MRRLSSPRTHRRAAVPSTLSLSLVAAALALGACTDEGELEGTGASSAQGGSSQGGSSQGGGGEGAGGQGGAGGGGQGGGGQGGGGQGGGGGQAGGGQGGGGQGGASASAELCVATGGTVDSALCCLATEAFPDTCAVGACGCAPDSSHDVPVCSCPAGCFDPALGCVPS